MTFDEFENQLFALFEEGSFQEGLDLIGSHSAEFPDQRQQLAYYQACLANSAGDSELALNTLSDAVDAGYWFSPGMLQNSVALQSLQGRVRFDQIMTTSTARMIDALAESMPSRVVFEPANDAQLPTPLLIVLHDQQSSAKLEAEQWAHLAEAGWLVVVPQSSQIEGPERYGWRDQVVAQEEIVALVAEISAEYPVDSDRIVLAGFAAGASCALDLVLSDSVATAGFIGIATNIDPARAKNSQSSALFFAVGDKNVQLAATQAAVDAWQQAGSRCHVYQYDGGAIYPSDMESVLNAAVAFLAITS